MSAWRAEVQTGGFDDGLAHDVRDLIWQLVLRDPSRAAARARTRSRVHLAARTLAMARECLREDYVAERDDIDPWACLRAALLSLSVVARLPALAEPADAELFDRLAELLAAPGDTICRDLAAEIREVA